MDNTISSPIDIFGSPIDNSKKGKVLNFFLFFVVIIVFFIAIVPWKSLNLEGMNGGTLTQLMAQDSQDVYLKSNVDKLATGNFTNFWNQPTRVANTFQNRGSPLPTFILPDTPMNPNPYPVIASNNYTDYVLNQTAKVPNCPYSNINNLNPIGLTQPIKQITSKSKKTFPNPILSKSNQNYENINGEKLLESDYLNQLDKVEPVTLSSSIPTLYDNVLPSSISISTLANSNPYELGFVAKQIATTQKTANNLPALTEWEPIDYMYQSAYDNLLYNKDCIKDPASCGAGSGGYRLGEDYVQATKAKPFVSIDGNTFYGDSYLGSYFIEPDFNIMRPIPFMPSNNLPPNPVKMG